ncbi:hypothetical protein BGZ57DRAFT_1007202 [Hyaloscypha finlandica]|nr:hypothetical protein BGZ57DRAFT_1007202 [Hyaloscypha finlandica]
MSSEAVHHYLWRDYGLPSRKGWILTLTDTEALALLSFVTTLVAYTQSRVWHIERNIFNRLTAPKIQLLVKDERASISQGAAIGVLIRALTRRRSTQPETIGIINPCIGFIASLNILGFVILGIILPWSLSGGVESPLVLARGTGECVRYEYSLEGASEDSMLADQTFRQCWNNQTRLPKPCTVMDGILAERPKIEISREDICPFLGDICKNNIRPVSFEYKHLSLRDFGVHSTSKVLLSRRLTCSPLETEKFLAIPSGSDCNNSKIWFGSEEVAIDDYIDDDVNVLGIRRLNSCNGPNRFSNQLSGRRNMVLNRHPVDDMGAALDLWVQPDYPMEFEGSHAIRLHPNLWHPDGQIFVLGLRVGPENQYPTIIDDPLFSAHDSRLNFTWDLIGNCSYEGSYLGIDCNTSDYIKILVRGIDSESELEVAFEDFAAIPDQEYTAIGCVEQHRFCVQQSPMICTTWGRRDILGDLPQILRDMEYQDALPDFELLHRQLVLNGNVADYLNDKERVADLVSSLLASDDYMFAGIDPNEQWIIELKAWMEVSLLRARYMMSRILLKPPQTHSDTLQYTQISQYCSRVMFLDGNYTNFDFTQLLIIVCCLVLLCVLSFESELLAAAKQLCILYGNVIGGAAVALAEMRHSVLKHLQVARWSASRPLWPRRRGELSDLPQRYPRNPFRDPPYRPRSEEYGLGEVSATLATSR